MPSTVRRAVKTLFPLVFEDMKHTAVCWQVFNNWLSEKTSLDLLFANFWGVNNLTVDYFKLSA